MLKLLFIGLFLSFFTSVFSQNIIWQEDFSSYSNGTSTGANSNTANPSNDWSVSYAPGGDNFSVQDNEFIGTNTDSEGIWTSEVIDISDYNYIEINIDARWGFTSLSNPDYLKFYYRLDGGPEIEFFSQESEAISIDDVSQTIDQVLSGSTVQIIAKIKTDRLQILFWYIDEYVAINNISVSEVETLYSRTNGNWNNGNTWSTNTFNEVQNPCGCTPTSQEVAIVGNDNNISLTSNENVGILEIQNEGILSWNGNFTMNIARGIANIKTGGSMSANGYTANVSFDKASVNYQLINNGNLNIASFLFPTADVKLDLSGTADINLSGNIDFQQRGIMISNNSLGTLSTRRITFNNDNGTLNNNGTLNISEDITAGNGDDNNKINNNSGGQLSFRNVSLTNANTIINNSGTINQSGYFQNIDNGSDFNNLDGSIWNYSYTGGTYDNSINNVLHCTDGTNLFNYKGNGNQNVIPITYSNLTLAGSGVKFSQGNIIINNSLNITEMARLNVANGNDNIQIAGNWLNNSSYADSFIQGNQTVTFNGSSDQTLNTSSLETFYRLTINKPGGRVRTGNDIAITNILNLTKGNINIGSNYLTIDAAASITGASANSYVEITADGGLTQKNIGSGGRTGDILFPVGMSNYAPVKINNTIGDPDNFTLRMCDGINLKGNCIDTPVNENVVSLTWFVDEDIPGGSDATLDFQWMGFNELTGFDRSYINVVHFDGSSWEKLNTTASSGLGPFNAVVTGVNSFSPFGVIYAEEELPVELISFEAELVDKTVNLNWKTASELNNDFFTVEKTVDFKTYVELAWVKGNGTSQIEHNYTFTDFDPFVGTSYYRLKQTDMDGTVTYSKPVKIENLKTQSLEYLEVYPIPNDGKDFKLRLADQPLRAEANIKIINLQGIAVYDNQVPISERKEISIHLNKSLAPGVYSILLTADKIITKKIIVSSAP